jgi:transposase InsO family protein
MAESFLSSLKGELIDTRAWPTRAGARRAVVEYIGWYNGTRLHSSLGYQAPPTTKTTTAKTSDKWPDQAIKPVRQSGATSPGQGNPCTRPGLKARLAKR